MQGQGGGALIWSVTVHWVYWPWGFPGGASQSQPQPVFCPGLLPELEPSQMTASCAGHRDTQAKQSCESRLAAASAGSRTT